MATKRQRLLENLSFISANVHSDHARYDRFYQAFATNGFPGIHQYCIFAAEAFTDVEGRLFWDGEYFEAIDAYSVKLIEGKQLLLSELKKAAREAIVEALTKNGREDDAARFEKAKR